MGSEIAMFQLTPEDKFAAVELAELLEVSCDDLIREFESLSMEEQAELERIVDEANTVLPEMHASLDRIAVNVSDGRSKVRAMNVHLLAMSERVLRIENSIRIPEAG